MYGEWLFEAISQTVSDISSWQRIAHSKSPTIPSTTILSFLVIQASICYLMVSVPLCWLIQK